MVRLPDHDSVGIHELSRDTQRAISEALEKSGWDVGKSWIDLPTCAAIFFLLKYSPDDPELFPKGKWATLQRLSFLETYFEKRHWNPLLREETKI